MPESFIQEDGEVLVETSSCYSFPQFPDTIIHSARSHLKIDLQILKQHDANGDVVRSFICVAFSVFRFVSFFSSLIRIDHFANWIFLFLQLNIFKHMTRRADRLGLYDAKADFV